MQFKDITRRGLFGVGAGALVTATSGSALAQAKSKPIKVASIYTVPVEQQWVSRIHKALNSAKDRVGAGVAPNLRGHNSKFLDGGYAAHGRRAVVGTIACLLRTRS